MGYRSDIKMTITVNTKKESVKKLLNELRNLSYGKEKTKFFDNDNEFNYCVFVSSKNKNVINIRFNDVKWYEDYEDVKAFMDWKNSLHDREHPYHYVRIGESIEDMEEDFDDSHEEIALKEIIRICRYCDFEELENE